MKMKIFHSIQKNFAILGVDLYQSKQDHAFNQRNVMVLIIFGLSLISGCVSVSHANTFSEYINAFHIGVTVAFGGLTFAIVMYQMKLLFAFIESIEKLIDESECNSNISCRIKLKTLLI